MIGELEYNTFFVDKSLFIADITRFIFTIFCILMPIVFMNLLVSDSFVTFVCVVHSAWLQEPMEWSLQFLYSAYSETGLF